MLFGPRICKEFYGISNGSLLAYCWTEDISRSRSYTTVLFCTSIYHVFHCNSTTFQGPFYNYVYYVKYPDDVNNSIVFPFNPLRIQDVWATCYNHCAQTLLPTDSKLSFPGLTDNNRQQSVLSFSPSPITVQSTFLCAFGHVTLPYCTIDYK